MLWLAHCYPLLRSCCESARVKAPCHDCESRVGGGCGRCGGFRYAPLLCDSAPHDCRVTDCGCGGVVASSHGFCCGCACLACRDNRDAGIRDRSGHARDDGRNLGYRNPGFQICDLDVCGLGNGCGCVSYSDHRHLCEEVFEAEIEVRVSIEFVPWLRSRGPINNSTVIRHD